MVEKETSLSKIQRLTNTQVDIRNVATSAHIHHGKTAFTDNLLAAAGKLSAKSAGDLDAGMATWQHSDEQERLLTVDAANVSMVHDFNGKDIEESNILFTEAVKISISCEYMLESMVENYKSDTNPIIIFNQNNLYFK